MNLSDYIIQSCTKNKVEHLFGVPGDYILDFCKELSKKNTACCYINMCNELNAGYAADAYARITGLGVALVTYGVGSLSLVNAVAGAFAEEVPLLIISGAPDRKKLKSNTNLHHMVNGYDTPFKIFSQITVKSLQIKHIEHAAEIIDEAFSYCISNSKPVYLEIAENLFLEELTNVPSEDKGKLNTPVYCPDHSGILKLIKAIEDSNYPLFIVGKKALKTIPDRLIYDLIGKISAQFMTLISDKGCLSEQNSLFLGTWLGQASSTKLLNYFNQSDLIIMFHADDHEVNMLGSKNPFLNKKTMIIKESECRITEETFLISSHKMMDALLNHHFEKKVKVLSQANPEKITPELKDTSFIISQSSPMTKNHQGNRSLSIDNFFDHLEKFIEPGDILIADIGTALFSALNLNLPAGVSFIAQSFYGSIGYSLPAALGASLSTPQRRVIVVVGDGAFQVSAQAISSFIKFDCKPIIFVLNNAGYTIERIITDGEFNDIQPWLYYRFAETFGGSKGLIANCPTSLLNAMIAARKTQKLFVIEVRTPANDPGKIMKRVIERF